MKRHEYIKNQANELHRLHTKRLKVSDRILKGDLSPKQFLKLDAELNWIYMQIGQTEERLAFALGYLLPQEAREEWHPSGWHSYKGIREELEKTELE